MSQPFRRALIVGAGGQVARALADAMPGRELLFTSSSGKAGAVPCDLSQPESIAAAFREVESRWGKGGAEVFLAGAMTHVDRCEVERDRCEAVNARGPGLVAEECRRLGFGLTYFSSEYVFGNEEYENGRKGPFSETDTPAPTSWYGHCKLAGERAVQAVLGEAALIVRTTMVFSYDAEGMNFLMQYLRQLELAREGKAPPFRVPRDQISTPAYAPDLGRDVVALRDRQVGGVIHLVGSDFLSREEIARRVGKAFGLEKFVDAAFTFATTAELKQPARRPLTAGLRVERAKALGLKPDSLNESLADAKHRRANA